MKVLQLATLVSGIASAALAQPGNRDHHDDLASDASVVYHTITQCAANGTACPDTVTTVVTTTTVVGTTITTCPHEEGSVASSSIPKSAVPDQTSQSGSDAVFSSSETVAPSNESSPPPVIASTAFESSNFLPGPSTAINPPVSSTLDNEVPNSLTAPPIVSKPSPTESGTPEVTLALPPSTSNQVQPSLTIETIPPIASGTSSSEDGIPVSSDIPSSTFTPLNSSTPSNQVPASLTAPPVVSIPSSSGAGTLEISTALPSFNSSPAPTSLTALPTFPRPSWIGISLSKSLTFLPSFTLGSTDVDSVPTSAGSSVAYGSLPASSVSLSTLSGSAPTSISSVSNVQASTFTLNNSVPVSSDQANPSTWSDSVPTSIGSVSDGNGLSTSSLDSALFSITVSQIGSVSKSPEASSQGGAVPSQTGISSIDLPTVDTISAFLSTFVHFSTDLPTPTNNSQISVTNMPMSTSFSSNIIEPSQVTSGFNFNLTDTIIEPTSFLTQPFESSVTAPISQDTSTTTDGALASSGTSISGSPSGTGYLYPSGNQTIVLPNPTYPPLFENLGHVVGADKSSIVAIIVAFAFAHFP